MSKVMISLPDKFLKELDSAAKADHRSRSELIREALRSYLKRPRPYKRPIDNPSVRKAYEYIIQHPFRLSAKSGSTQAIRKRRYSDSDITRFLKEDRLDRKTAKKVGSRLRLPNKARKKYQADPLYKRRGSFDGPSDLAEHHDHYLR